MTRYLILILLFTQSFSAWAQEEEVSNQEFVEHCHFSERSLTIGIGAPYSITHENLGVNVRMYYNIGENICFGPEYAYFKNAVLEIVDFDFVGHYIFELPGLGLYPLAGANYTTEKELHIDEWNASLGLVWGLGIHRNFNDLTAFAEYSRVEFGLTDEFVTLGFMYTLK